MISLKLGRSLKEIIINHGFDESVLIGVQVHAGVLNISLLETTKLNYERYSSK